MIRPDHKKYLAFFDILGFEALYNEIGIEEIIIKYEEFISLVSKMEKEAGCCLVNAGGMQMSIMMSIYSSAINKFNGRSIVSIY